jgi:hypothetical protein
VQRESEPATTAITLNNLDIDASSLSQSVTRPQFTPCERTGLRNGPLGTQRVVTIGHARPGGRRRRAQEAAVTLVRQSPDLEVRLFTYL